jgi:hypothetical protein
MRPTPLLIALCLLASPATAEQPAAQDSPDVEPAPIVIEPLGRLDPEVALELNRADGGSRALMARVGQSRYVAATIAGREVYLLLEPSAPLLALDAGFLRSVGLRPEPVGQGTQSIGLLERLSLGQLVLTAHTYTTCQSCALGGLDRPVVGRLGQNVLARLVIKLDDAAGRVDVAPGPAFHERARDVAPWITLKTKIEPFVGIFGQLNRLHTHAVSRAPRAATITARYVCTLPGDRLEVFDSAPRSIEAMGAARIEVDARTGACVQLETTLGQATW